MRRICTVCGTPTPAGQRRCNAHGGTHTGWSPNRDRQAQARFRTALLTRATHQCEATNPDGTRCTNTTNLRACHLTPLHQGGTYDTANGALLCRDHDKHTDPYAR
jgi:predicted nucleic acid-binding Zn ribbon protein